MEHLKKMVMILVGVVFLCAGSIPLWAADAPASVTIAGIKDKKSAVDFPHQAHAPLLAGKCANCHVKADGGGGLKPALKTKPADMASALKHPFHTQCLDCHKASKNAKAPTACNGCHK
ncbi:MAG: cytochrome c3 family protein [Deltaproteobacteria bacterium]|nr:cytochrome c3 family protein [Deltaproteobacteria bacterium]